MEVAYRCMRVYLSTKEALSVMALVVVSAANPNSSLTQRRNGCRVPACIIGSFSKTFSLRKSYVSAVSYLQG